MGIPREIKQGDLKALKEYIFYNPLTGIFFWVKKPSPLSNKCKDSLAGCYDFSNGYWKIAFRKRTYTAHRLAWFFVNGLSDQNKFIDHIDCNKLNNSISNLRLVNATENAYNSKKQSNNTSGVKGVTFIKRTKRWGCRLSINGVNKSLASFELLSDAKDFIEKAREKFHKEFCNHG